MRITDVLAQHGVMFLTEGHEHCRPGWVNFDCPFCSPGWCHYRMGIALSSLSCNCWACGRHSTTEVIHKLTGLPWARCKELLSDVDRGQVRWEAKPHGTLKLPVGVGPLLQVHNDYLLGRGFDPEHAALVWGVGGIGRLGRHRWRLFLPITRAGALVSWTTRAIADRAADGSEILRYLSAEPEQEAFPHRELLYGGDKVPGSTALIVEGPTDVWRIGEGAVATFGTGYTRAQVLLLSRYAVRVVCYDNEPVAQRQAGKLCDELEAFPGETYNVVLRGKDPGSASKKEVARLRRRFL